MLLLCYSVYRLPLAFYSYSGYSDTPVKVTVLANPKPFVNQKNHLLTVDTFCVTLTENENICPQVRYKIMLFWDIYVRFKK